MNQPLIFWGVQPATHARWVRKWKEKHPLLLLVGADDVLKPDFLAQKRFNCHRANQKHDSGLYQTKLGFQKWAAESKFLRRRFAISVPARVFAWIAMCQ